MDPIEIEAPDGTIVEFPAGTDDATIERAMREAFPAAAGPAGGPTAGAPEEQEAPAGGSLRRDERGKIVVRVADLDRSQPAHATWAELAEQGKLNPNMPLGSDQNPYVLPPGMSDEALRELVEAGVTFIDAEGRLQRKADDLYGFFVGAARPVNNTLDWLQGGLDHVGLGDEFGDFRAEHMRSTTDEGMAELEELARRAGIRPGRGGQFVGSVAATAPLALATRNPWVLGAAEGALGSNAEDAAGLARDTAFGALVGKGGDVVARGLGAVIDPQIAAPTRRLLDEGVELSPGQLAGGAWHRLEDASTGLLGVGDIVNASQRRAEESVARVAFQRPLSSIGVEMPRNMDSVHQMVDFTQREVGRAYDELIPQLNVRLDQQFAADFRSLDAAVRNMQDPQVQQWERLIRSEVAPRFNAAVGPANGRITGESFKELESILSREVRDFSAGNASPHDRRYAAAVRELQAQLRDMLARGNPRHAERLQSINDAYRQLSVLEDAAASAPAGARGRFTPAQLEQAARRADPTVRRRAAARGDALFQDLSQDAGEIMRRTVNDSGTATRGALTTALGAAFLGQSLNVSVNPWAVGALALGALPYNRGGNRAFTALMARRPEWAERLRTLVDQNSPLAAIMASANNQVGRSEDRDHRAENEAMYETRERLDAIQREMAPQEEGLLDTSLEGLY